MTSHFLFWKLTFERGLLLSEQLPLYLECNFSFNLPHHSHGHKQTKPLVHTQVGRASTIPCCQSMNRWWCMKQWQCNRMCYYLGIISLDLALPAPWIKMGRRAWRDSAGFSSHRELMKEVEVWADRVQLSEASSCEMSLLTQSWAGSSDTNIPRRTAKTQAYK